MAEAAVVGGSLSGVATGGGGGRGCYRCDGPLGGLVETISGSQFSAARLLLADRVRPGHRILYLHFAGSRHVLGYGRRGGVPAQQLVTRRVDTCVWLVLDQF